MPSLPYTAKTTGDFDTRHESRQKNSQNKHRRTSCQKRHYAKMLTMQINENKPIAFKLPSRIAGLERLAYNLWWSWHLEPRELFKSLDRPLWKAVGHNPIKLLQCIEPYRLVAAAQNPTFLAKYDAVMRKFDEELTLSSTWINVTYPELASCTIAFFSPEFAIHRSLPIYAGGLGILAGDYCKEASDLGLPLVGIGFMYPKGYFHQHLLADGWQEEIFEELNFNEAPIARVLTQDKRPLIVNVPLNDSLIHLAIWEIKLGRVKLYLMDTNIEQNSPPDREISSRLYISDREMRLKQEIILGIGGVRLLRALGINPTIWHANEGHTAFMMLERIRELVAAGKNFDSALNEVQATTVFTTHTPVPAGNDVFSLELIEKYFHNYWESLGLQREQFFSLGKAKNDDADFNMTVLGLKLSNHRNGVSQLHGWVCRGMWHSLWPELDKKDVPILAVTNGVHVPTWLSHQMFRLFNKYLGGGWLEKHDDPTLWERVMDIPDEELIAARRWLKGKLIAFVKSRARKRWCQDYIPADQALALGGLLDTEVLTIGYARRFTDYKRPSLILHDMERLRRLLCDDLQPIQIIFAGKAHPQDERGKQLIKEVFQIAKDPKCGGRIAFVEDYDMQAARYMVQGVDVWLNTPRQLQEASGTSGMKAAINGVLHLSVLDGWWYQGYNGNNGWAIGCDIHSEPSTDQHQCDAEALHDTLENKVIPLYYERDMSGVPHRWAQMIKESIRSILPRFSARRMAKEYTALFYLPVSKHLQQT